MIQEIIEGLKGTLKEVRGYALSAAEDFYRANRKSEQDFEAIIKGLSIEVTFEERPEKDFLSDPLGWLGDRAEDAHNALVGGFISMARYTYDLTTDPVNTLKSTGADIVNGTVAFVGGVATVGEDVVDLLALAGTGVATFGTLIYDGINGTNVTASMWENTMSFVAEDWVQNAIQAEYAKEGSILNNMDKLAHDPWKSDGMGCTVLNTAGYIAGTTVLAAASGGASVAVQGARVAGTAITKTAVKQALKTTVKTTGKTLKNAFTNKGVSAVAKREANKTILNHTGRSSLSSSFTHGTSDSWEIVNQSEGTTAEKVLRSLARGGITTGWEQLTRKIPGVKGTISKNVIGAVVNVADTPLKSVYDSAQSGKSLAVTFADRGGIESTLKGGAAGAFSKAQKIQIRREEIKSTLYKIKKYAGEGDIQALREFDRINDAGVGSKTLQKASERSNSLARKIDLKTNKKALKTRTGDADQIVQWKNEIEYIDERIEKIEKAQGMISEKGSKGSWKHFEDIRIAEEELSQYI